MITDAIAEFFHRNDWSVEPLDIVDDAWVSSVSGEHGTWPLVIALVSDYLVVQSVVPPVAPDGDEVRVLELLTRMNDGLVAGCFELNFDDGTIRLRSSVPVSALGGVGDDVLVEFVTDVVTANVLAADKFVPALEAVIDSGVAPAIALSAVDAGIDPHTFAR